MKYSIITPVYNRADCIERCLDSVTRNLKYGIELEHIVVDDGSEDESSEIIRLYTEHHDHVKFIVFAENCGTNAARNAAIAKATGDFCIILDSDDYFVDDAISFINQVVSTNDYQAYMFAADDMVDYYKINKIIRGRETVELNFHNFLRGEMGGDFIHCVSSKILKSNPFDENLRVYEGVFFLRFFKEAQNMLFTNRVVTIRERSRKDSVTRTMIASNREAIRKHYKADQLRYAWFKRDYVTLMEYGGLGKLLNDLLFYSLLLSDSSDSREWYGELKNYALPIEKKSLVIYKLHAGWLYYFLLKCFFTLKYSVLHKKIS